MKGLPPTLKSKKRYIAFKVLIEGDISKKEVIHTIFDEVTRLYGEIDVSCFGIWVLEFDEKSKTGFLVCNRSFKGKVVAGLGMIGYAGSKRASFQILGVSGTIKALKRKFLKDGSDKSELKGEKENATNT